MPLATTLAIALATASPPVEETQGLHRQAQLGAHQALGLGALGAMGLTGAAGWYLDTRRDAGAPSEVTAPLATAHHFLALGAGALYVSAATLALLAPPPPFEAPDAGWDAVWLHRGLAMLHGAAVASTFVLGVLSAEQDPAFFAYHRALGLTAFGLMASSAAVIALDF